MEVPQDKEISFKQDMEIDVKKDMDISVSLLSIYSWMNMYNIKSSLILIPGILATNSNMMVIYYEIIIKYY